MSTGARGRRLRRGSEVVVKPGRERPRGREWETRGRRLRRGTEEGYEGEARQRVAQRERAS